MPIKSNTTTTTGQTEDVSIMLLSDAVEQYTDGQLEDAIVIVIPDTGKAQFNPSHVIATGKSAGKDSKAIFVVAELGSSFAGAPIPYRQTNGHVAQLPLAVKLSVVATPPNRSAKTVEEALNQPVKQTELHVVAA